MYKAFAAFAIIEWFLLAARYLAIPHIKLQRIQSN